MKSSQFLSLSEGRKKIFQIADDVQAPDSHIVLTVNGVPKVVMVSWDEFDSWQETKEVNRQFPNLDETVSRVEKDITSGKINNYPTVHSLLEKEDLVLAEKIVPYEISRKGGTGSNKKTSKAPRA